ncbi:hypothetical protein NC651_030130 [Populus alba x Populus x berolinensis]|nr:hypothetical protein NC651_030130 [Populus alba x Populus x berolinensis]
MSASKRGSVETYNDAKSKRRVGPYVSQLERLVTEKPKTHDCDAKNLSHTTTKLPSLSLDSYLAVLQISCVIPIECFQIFILLPQICAPKWDGEMLLRAVVMLYL